jgi:hypothetical protein
MADKTNIVIDFYVQTESGLKRDIRESGVENIDPWEDMKEDVFFIEQYFLPMFPVSLKEAVQAKIGTKYIARFLLRSPLSFDDFVSTYKAKLIELKINGWAPTSLGGFTFKIAQYEVKSEKKLMSADCELNKMQFEGILNFNQRTKFKKSLGL